MNREEPKLLATLEQRPLPWRRQTLALYEDRFELTVRGWLDRYKVPFYLHNTKDEPDRVIVVPWLWLVFSAAAIAGSAVLWAFARTTPERLLAFALDALGLAALALQMLRMRPRLVYTYKPTSPDRPNTPYEPHLYIAPAQPSAEEVRKFVELATLTHRRHVEKMKAEQEGEGGIAYARELERFADLRAKDVLSEDEFTRVKAKLLNLRPKRMGFK